jgi:hypothetical protein
MFLGLRLHVIAASALVLALSCWFGEGGLRTSDDRGDVGLYENYARATLDGALPYRDFYVEYPPLALPVFVAPALVTEDDERPGSEVSVGYVRTFKFVAALFALLTLLISAAILIRLDASPRELAFSLSAMAIAPLALGSVFLNRYDVWPTALAVAGLWALLARRAATSGALLALSFAAKVFAVSVLPVTGIRAWRMGAGNLRRVAIGFICTAIASVGSFVVLAPAGLRFSYWTQAQRQLEVESIGGSLILAADRVGLYDARVVWGPPGSIDVAGALADGVAMFSVVLQLAAVCMVAVLYLQGEERDGRLVAAFATAVAAFVLFGKVLSPQYLIWLVPLIPLVTGARGRAATVVFLVSLVGTQVELHGLGLTSDGYAVWTILTRNLLLIVVFGLLVSELRHQQRPTMKTFVT